MKIEHVPFTNILWGEQQTVEVQGETGRARSQTVKTGDLSVRIVVFSPGYRADHWCAKGHIVFVLEGEITTDLDDGRSFHTTAGNSFHVGDTEGHHRVYTETGAKVFIVD